MLHIYIIECLTFFLLKIMCGRYFIFYLSEQGKSLHYRAVKFANKHHGCRWSITPNIVTEWQRCQKWCKLKLTRLSHAYIHVLTMSKLNETFVLLIGIEIYFSMISWFDKSIYIGVRRGSIRLPIYPLHPSVRDPKHFWPQACWISTSWYVFVSRENTWIK